MNIEFDGHWLHNGPPSGKNVVHGMINAWLDSFPQDRVTVSVPNQNTAQYVPAGAAVQILETRLPTHGIWAMTQLGNAYGKASWVVSQNFTPLFSSRKTNVATFFHDAIFMEHPEWFTFRERAYLGLAAKSLRRANIVLTSSNAEACRITRIFPKLQMNTSAVGLAAPLALTQGDATPTPQYESLEPFILSVGRLNVRKNLERLIEAFLSSSHTTSLNLLIVGEANGESTALTIPDDRIKLLGHVSDNELAYLYSRCEYFIFPSLDEGFGLPLLEAAHFGARSICSAIPSFLEIGLSERYFNPYDTLSIRESIDWMLAHPGSNSRTPGAPATWVDCVRETRSKMISFEETT